MISACLFKVTLCTTCKFDFFASRVYIRIRLRHINRDSIRLSNAWTKSLECKKILRDSGQERGRNNTVTRGDMTNGHNLRPTENQIVECWLIQNTNERELFNFIQFSLRAHTCPWSTHEHCEQNVHTSLNTESTFFNSFISTLLNTFFIFSRHFNEINK